MRPDEAAGWGYGGLVVHLVPTITVVVDGSVDESNVVALATGIERAAARGERVVLDLARVDRIDAAGLQAIAAARRRLGNRFEVARVSPVLAAVLAAG